MAMRSWSTFRFACIASIAAFLVFTWRIGETSVTSNAVALLQSGNLPAAEKAFAEVAESASKSCDVIGEAVARKYLAVTLARSGSLRIAEATNEIARALTILRPLADEGNSAARAELGFVLFDLTEILRVEAESAMRDKRSTGLTPPEFFQLVAAYVSPAEKALEEARSYYPEELLADVAGAQAEWNLFLARLTSTFLPADDPSALYEEARKCFEEALDQEQARGMAARADTMLSARLGIAMSFRERAVLTRDAEHAKGLIKQALACVTSADIALSANRELDAELFYLRSMCRLDLAGDALTRAAAGIIEKDLLDVAATVEDMRSKVAPVGSFERSSSFFSQRTHAYESLAVLYARTGQPEKMILAVERMKARAFRDMMDDGVELSSAPDGVLDLGRLKERLRKEDAGLVEYFYVPDSAWVLIVSPSGNITVQEIHATGQEVCREIQAVLAGFSDLQVVKRNLALARKGLGNVPVMVSAFEASLKLHDLLLGPVTASLVGEKTERLYIVPHHQMHYLPFNALVTRMNSTNLLASQYYVETGLPITYLPSAATLTGVPLKQAQGKSMVFARSDFKTVKPNFPVNLLKTGEEADMAVKLLSADLFVEKEATEERFRQMAGLHKVIYLATHGVLDVGSPMDSAVLLAATGGGESSQSDGRLSARELMTELRGQFPADLVVLSACLTNRGESNPNSGDEITALSRAFLVAGGRSVIATQWAASDDTFPGIMEAFLRAWQTDPDCGMSRAAALQQSLRSFLAKPDAGIYRHPLFWAPVVLIGDGE